MYRNLHLREKPNRDTVAYKCRMSSSKRHNVTRGAPFWRLHKQATDLLVLAITAPFHCYKQVFTSMITQVQSQSVIFPTAEVLLVKRQRKSVLYQILVLLQTINNHCLTVKQLLQKTPKLFT